MLFCVCFREITFPTTVTLLRLLVFHLLLVSAILEVLLVLGYNSISVT